jgi:type IV fimbrial biogenesis protein FimT
MVFMKRGVRGLTLLELMLVLAMTAVLAAMAVPSFRSLMVKRAVGLAAQSLVDDLRYARSEAIKRGGPITVCQSSSGSACNPGGSWAEGWIVFVDRGAKGMVDAGDEVLRVQPRPAAVESIASRSPGNDKASFTYQSTGAATPASQTFIVTPAGPVAVDSVRLVCISSQGRPRVAAAKASTCS